MYYAQQIKGEKTKRHFKDAGEIKSLLKCKIFARQNGGAYLFEEDNYAIVKKNVDPLVSRCDVDWEMIKSKYRYSIFQYEYNFVLRTFKNELHPKENEFVISIDNMLNRDYTVLLVPLAYKMEQLIFYSR